MINTLTDGTSFINKWVFNALNFKVLMVLGTMLTAIPYLHYHLGGYIKYILAYGILVCISFFINGRLVSVCKFKTSKILLVFALSYAITIFLNRQSCFEENIKQLVYMIVFFILLFMTPSDMNEEELKKEMNVVVAFFLGITFAFSCFSFATFVLQFYSGYRLPGDDYAYWFGMQYGRLWGLYNPNTGAMLNALSFIMSWFSLKVRKNHRLSYWADIFFALNMVLQFCCLVATGTRTAFYALVIVIFIYVFFEIKSKKGEEKNLFTPIISAVALSVLTMGVYEIVQYVLSILPSLVKNSFQINITYGQPIVLVNFSTVDKLDMDRELATGFLNGRDFIWSAAIDAFKEYSVFGITRERIEEIVPSFLDSNTMIYAENISRGGLHNIYITILVSSGIIGAVVFLVFLAKILLSVYKVMFSSVSITEEYWLCLTVFFLFLISEMFESRVLYQVNVFNVLFWMFSGYMFRFSEIKREKRDRCERNTI